MLVLSRKPGQKIKIGDDIEVTIIAVSGETVRIGIEAPTCVRILRTEVYEEIQKRNGEAVTSTEIPPALKSLLSSLGGSND